MKTWQKWLVRVCKLKGTLDTERVLREDKKRILELERENAELKSRLWHPRLVHVEIDQAGQKAAQSQASTYEPPDRNTDKPRILYNTRGRYAQQRWPEFRQTHLLPTFKRPPQDEPPMTLDMTQVRIPTWLL